MTGDAPDLVYVVVATLSYDYAFCGVRGAFTERRLAEEATEAEERKWPGDYSYHII